MPSAHADCPCGGGELEIVFVLDCSGSMNHTLLTLQEQIRRIGEALEGQIRHVRFAAVVYRTREYVGKLKKLEVLPFTRDRDELREFLNRQAAEGGGEELIAESLAAAASELRWTQGARKVAVLLGDEQASVEDQPRCLEQARALKERGIVLHTVTASQTAWIYWTPPDATSWKQQMQGMSQDEKRVFRLPYYSAMAAATGGLSVSSWNSKELVLWLLAFGLGLNERDAKAKIDVDRFMDWARQRELDEKKTTVALAPLAASGAPLLAWVKHDGEWNVPHRFEGLLAHLGGRLALSGPPLARTLTLLDPALERFPILYTSGHGPVRWSFNERAALKRRLLAGGFLFADACCGDAEFTRSLRAVLEELFPGRPLAKLDPAHPLFTCGHRLENVLRSAEPRSGRLEAAPPDLLGLQLPDGAGRERLAAVLSPSDLGCGWQSRVLGVPCQHQDSDALMLSANIFLWALTR